jgi:small subunit ribosomal protein S27e
MKKPDSKFVKVRCKDCENEQVLFNKSSSVVSCHICGSKLAIPKGGKAEITGELLEMIE